jgi:hypothetical protein
MRSLGLIGLLCVAACAAATEKVAGTEQDMSPTDRLFVGAANPYPADLTLRDQLPTLKTSMAARREAAWKIAQRVLEPVSIDNGTRTLPRFQTWYAKEEVLPIFDHLLRAQSPQDLAAHRKPTDAEVQAGFDWIAQRAIGTAAGSDDKVASRRQELDTNGDQSLGGPERVLMSPEVLSHLYQNYDSIIGCLTSFPGANDAPPSADNFASCMGTEMPEGAVIVKARWVPDTLPLDAWDTSADGVTKAMTAGEWGTAPRTANPNASQIYTMTLSSGIRMRLAALHIMSKELRDWAWVSLFWSDQPNVDFGADRPADFLVGGPLAPVLANYKMCTTVAYDEADDGSSLAGADPTLSAVFDATRGPRTWCSNPYLESSPNNAKTNCIGCHQHAGTDLETTSILEGDHAFPDGSREQVRKNFPADYTFITSTGLALATVMQAKVNQLAPKPPAPPDGASSH